MYRMIVRVYNGYSTLSREVVSEQFETREEAIAFGRRWKNNFFADTFLEFNGFTSRVFYPLGS